MSRTAGIIVIGNEILSGRTAEENAVFLLKQLRELGVDVHKVSFIRDELTEVRDEVRSFASLFDHVFTSGGVGPTHDDVTIAGVAAAFSQGIRREPALVRALERYYQSELTEVMLRMADVPDGAVLVGAEHSIFPVVTVRNVYFFPGVPQILTSKFERIKELFREAPYHVVDVFLNVDEGEVADTLDAVLSAFPDLSLGSYPAFNRPDFKVKLTLESKDPEYLERSRSCLLEKLAEQSIMPVEAAPAASLPSEDQSNSPG